MGDIGLEEMAVRRRVVGVEGQVHTVDGDPPASTRKGRKRRKSRESQNSASDHELLEVQRRSPSAPNSGRDHGGAPKGAGNGGPGRRLVDGKEKGWEFPQEDLRAQFYEHYRKEAEEYDKDFMKKHDEDLNTTLIFAGLFSAVTGAFVIQIHPLLESDSTDETAALLRVMLYQMDNTTFGGDIPPLPQWTGAPRMMIHVQAMLYASLAASLFSAFLAMLGKQWLNRYVATGMRGTGIERSRDRQRKLDGIIAWYFDHVMESLPVMLQIALLLLGCALSLYLWGIDVTIACVVIAVTALGVISYIFAVVAGTASTSCPYQTPGARILRYVVYHILPDIHYHILRPIPGLLRSAPGALISTSAFFQFFEFAWGMFWEGCVCFFPMYILGFPFLLVYDAYQLTRPVARALVAIARRVGSWIRSTRSARARRLNQQAAALDSQCISWILQTSLERGIRLSTLKLLATTPTLVEFSLLLASNCFDILIDCIKVNNRNPVIVQGMEQLAEASAMCFFLTYSHLSTMDPMSSILEDIRQRYGRIFTPDPNYVGLPFPRMLGRIHEVIHPRWEYETPTESPTEWMDYKPTDHEYVAVAHALTKLSWSERQRNKTHLVPRQCIRFAAHSLSQHPVPPLSVVADCLLIFAMNVDCNISNAVVLGESTQPEEICNLITQKLDAMDYQVPDWQQAEAVQVLFWYAVHQERCGDTIFFDAILRLAGKQSNQNPLRELLWPLGVPKMFTQASPRAIIHVTPHLRLATEPISATQDLISEWVAAVSVAPRTEEVARSVVITLLQIAAHDDLWLSIPADVWLWFNERPSLPPPDSLDRRWKSNRRIVRTIRGLNDASVLTSYLIMIWTDLDIVYDDDYPEMRASVREDFKGIDKGCYRAELIQRLDYVLVGGRHLPNMKDEYEELRMILQEADQEATGILNCMPHRFIFLGLLTLMDLRRIPFHIHVCSAVPVFIISHLARSALCETNRFVVSMHSPR